jgi:hypothetical protein
MVSAVNQPIEYYIQHYQLFLSLHQGCQFQLRNWDSENGD